MTPGRSTSPSRNAGLSRLAGTFSAFSIPAYRLIWLSQVSSTTGMQMQMFARGLLAYELGGQAAAIGFVTLGQAIPQFFFSMVGGAIADRFERRKTMILTQALTAVAATIVAIMVKADVMTVNYLFIAGLVQGTIMSFGGPARQAFIVEVVGEKELMNALALNQAAMNLSRIGAPSIAGVLVAVSWIDLGGLYFIQAVLNVFSLVLLFALPFVAKGMIKAAEREQTAAPAGEPHAARQPRRGSMARDFVDGMRYIRTSPMLVTLLLIGLVPTLLGQSYQQFLPVFAKNVFGDGIGRNAGALGFMGTMTGVGALAGALSVATLSGYKRRAQLQLAAGLGFGICLAGFATQNNYGAAILFLVGLGFMSSFFQSLNSTMLMTASDPAYYGRVMSVNMLTWSLSSFSTFGIGYFIDWIGRVEALDLLGVQATYFGIGLIVMAFMIAVAIFNPSYRRLELSDLSGRPAKPGPVPQAASGS